MKKKIITILILLIIPLTLVGCTKTKTSEDAIAFKTDYESLNGKKNKNGKEYRKISISKNNPIVITDAKTIIEMIENGESFYVYFGSKLCPWCRSVIEKAIEIANENEIDKIYYVDIWDDEGNEILRDKYTLDEDKEQALANEGTEEYFKLLGYLNDILPDYTYAANKNGGDKLEVQEKRIYVPLFVYISKGKPIRETSGLSEKQKDSREKLTKEVLKDEEQLFDDFFINVCDESC